MSKYHLDRFEDFDVNFHQLLKVSEGVGVVIDG